MTNTTAKKAHKISERAHCKNTHTQARKIQQRTHTYVCIFVHIKLVTCLCLSACDYVCVLCWLITASAFRSVLVAGMTVWKKEEKIKN